MDFSKYQNVAEADLKVYKDFHGAFVTDYELEYGELTIFFES